ISVPEEGTAHGSWKSRIKHAVAKTSGDAIALVHAAWTVMVQMIFLHAPKEGESRIGEVQRVVQPFFGHVALHHASEQDGHRVNRKEKTDGSGDKKQRENVFQFTADVPSVERPHVMIPMERIEALMEKFREDAIAGGETTVQDVAVEEVLDESPCDTARGEEGYGEPWELRPR